MLKYARSEIMAGPVSAPRQKRSDKPTITLLGEMFPADPMLIAQMIAPMGIAVGTVAPTREWRELYSALDSAAVAAIHPFYIASIREFEAAGRPIVGSAPVGVDGTHDWLGAIGQAMGIASAKVDTARNATLGAIRGVLSQQKINGR
jgi:chlorophyllide a reductase subunit Y